MDEHFAKSLGSAWTRIKSCLDTRQTPRGGDERQASPPPPQQQQQQQQEDAADNSSSMWNGEPPHSVDDHFAKALGCDTWLRIKAEHDALVADAAADADADQS